MNFFCRFFFVIFDKKCRAITFKCLLLFIALGQVVFKEKVNFINTTSFNYSSTKTWLISFLRIWSHLLKKSVMENFIFCAVIYNIFNQSNGTHFAVPCWEPIIIKGICNTLCSNGISLNVTLVSTACPGLLVNKLKNIFDGSG